MCSNKAFHTFGQAKFAYGVLVLSTNKFLPLPQLPQKKITYLKSG